GLVFTSFSGGISNASGGKIVSTQGIGIFFGTSRGVVPRSSAGGGIPNSGTIAAHQSGILLQNFATFAGGISNSGRIAGRSGIALKTITLFGTPNAEGGITNAGVIAA